MGRCKALITLLFSVVSLLSAGVAAADEAAPDQDATIDVPEEDSEWELSDDEIAYQRYHESGLADMHAARRRMCLTTIFVAPLALAEKVLRPDLRYEFAAQAAADEEGTLVLSWPFGFTILTAQLAESRRLNSCALCYHLRGIIEVQRPLVDEPDWRFLALSRSEFSFFAQDSLHFVGLVDGGYQRTREGRDLNGPVAGLGFGVGMAWDYFALRLAISGRSAFLAEETVHSVGVELAWYVYYRERFEFRSSPIRPFPQFDFY